MTCYLWNQSRAGEQICGGPLSWMKCVLISFVLFLQVTEGQEAIKGTLHLGDAAAIKDCH